MTIRDFFRLAQERYLADNKAGGFFFELFLRRFIEGVSSVPGQDENWQGAEVTSALGYQLYGSSLGYLQFLGMGLCNTGDPDEPIWETFTELAKALRSVLIEQLQLDLPEARVTSLVTEMVEHGLLEEVRLEDGQRGVKPVENPYGLRIRITKVPAGGAPEQVRRSWVGVTLPARRESAQAIHTNLATGELSPGGGGWVVPAQEAIEALAQVDQAAAQWFVDRCSDVITFAFRGDEAEIITE